MQASQSATQALDIALIIVRNEFSKLPDDGDAISEKVCNKLKTTFEKPPTAEFEAIIHKNFSDDEVRVVLFNPSIDQAWFYVAILQVGAAVPVHHNFRKLMSLALSLIFMIHR
jgi:aspartyl/asparaginyl beta-hydroxylase (cupin superfamily)